MYRSVTSFTVLRRSVEWALKVYIPLRRKTLRIGSLHWLRPTMLQFHVGDTNMLVSKNARICVTPNANAKICITPNVNPQRKQVEYRWHWVPNVRGWQWPCTFYNFITSACNWKTMYFYVKLPTTKKEVFSVDFICFG